MSNKYSLGGYRIAVQTRTSKTILVEGRDDKDLFDHLKISFSGAERLNIDTQDIMHDINLVGLGAKARIDYFIGDVPVSSPVWEKLRCFVDREWEELIDPATLNSVPWSAPDLTGPRLKTDGHSIENYGFDFDFVTSYLLHFGQAVATDSVMNDVKQAMPELLKAGAAFSDVARRKGLLGRCGDIAEVSDLHWDGSRIYISPKIEQSLVSRGAPSAGGFIEEFERAYLGRWSTVPFCNEAHLHSHGHLGEMILWLGVGSIAVANGFSDHVGNEIAFGRRDEKRRVWHTWLATLLPAKSAPISLALSEI